MYKNIDVPEGYEDERWVPIKGTTKYFISTKGRVYGPGKSKKGEILHPTRTKKGYYEFGIKINGKDYKRTLHRSLGEAFIPNINNDPYVRHLNDNRDDNSLENLVWGTEKDNTQDSIRNGTSATIRSKIPVKVTDINSNIEVICNSISDASAYTGALRSSITRVLRGDSNHAKGYRFEYVNRNNNSTKDIRTRITYAKILATNNITGETYEFDTQREAEKKLGIDNRQINNVLKNRRNSASGFTFEYVFNRDGEYNE